ncbi:MAG TPA: amino acid ABC transporter permease [Candidatus Methylomirabilis sp.]|nr:amino acid ABC transporter permease [Candidatus Methylomirabilis sp.]
MGYELQWSVLWDQPYREWILEGLYLTCQISMIAWLFGLTIGILVGMLAESPRQPLAVLSACYVEVFRNIPLLVQLFFAYFVIPLLLPTPLRRHLYDIGWEWGSAVFTLTVYTSAKVTGHVRSGLNAVGHGLRQAALSTGLTWWQMERWVVVPLLLRIIVPSITTEFLTVFKGSSLAMAVGVTETTYMTQRLGFQTFRWIEANTVGTVVYLLLAWAVAILMGIVERRVRVPGLLHRGQV